MRKVAGGLLASSLALAGPAVPAQAEPSAAQRFTVAFKLTNADPQPLWSVVVANGTIKDRGTLRFGEDNAVLHQDLFILSQGTIVLTEPANPTTEVFRFDPVSCVGSDIATGTYQMTGTGGYAGVTGQGTYRHHAIIIAPRKPGCSPADPQTVGYVTFKASGTAVVGDRGTCRLASTERGAGGSSTVAAVRDARSVGDDHLVGAELDDGECHTAGGPLSSEPDRGHERGAPLASLLAGQAGPVAAALMGDVEEPH